MIIRLSVLVRYTKRTKSLISDLKMGALMVTLERSSHPGDSRVLLLINNEIIQMRNGASEYTYRSKHPEAFRRRCRCWTLLSLIFPLSICLLLLILKECVTLLPEFSTSQMSEQNDLITAQNIVCFV